ncbi:SDR family oxidoreductase [Weissella bombi]|uniref:NADP-dependent 3-hydroxy acid dehydrogenase YdfG n=1 Tax=Weissella bombi TaxID=1505725 RepID=A0A1C3ZJU5_9LACO|nr:SDR family oxidoreductase [Weissella bombi]SCB82490.1 NADP-dependent 3-hydroxy acid dehydrogenase YdfG [Weissella bombi]
MSIKDKVIVITGASSGIGAATVVNLAKQHAKLVIGARRVDKLDELKEKYSEAEIITQKVDVTNFDEVNDLVTTAIDHFGKIDVLFNNAGIMPINPLIKGARDEWQNILNVNVMGVLNGIAAALPIMQSQKFGHIIATDSVAGHVVVPNLAVYNGSKFAVRAIMEGLRQEHHNDGIRTSIVSPGAVATELYKSSTDEATQQAELENEKEIGLSAENVATAVAYAIDTPDNMDINEIIIRPIKQPV